MIQSNTNSTQLKIFAAFIGSFLLSSSVFAEENSGDGSVVGSTINANKVVIKNKSGKKNSGENNLQNSTRISESKTDLVTSSVAATQANIAATAASAAALSEKLKASDKSAAERDHLILATITAQGEKTRVAIEEIAAQQLKEIRALQARLEGLAQQNNSLKSEISALKAKLAEADAKIKTQSSTSTDMFENTDAGISTHSAFGRANLAATAATTASTAERISSTKTSVDAIKGPAGEDASNRTKATPGPTKPIQDFLNSTHSSDTAIQ